MNILITGAAGFVGKNLSAALQNVRDGKDKTHPGLTIDELYLYDTDTGEEQLPSFCARADFVFHLAGVNRPKDPAEFMEGNVGFSETLLKALKDLRSRLAKEENVPAYVVFSNATLEDMAAKLPQTIEALLGVSGVGAVKAERYGKPFLELLKQFQSQQ